MNLQGTFLGMLGTVSAITALDKQANITAATEEASFKQQKAEREFNANEATIMKESPEIAARLKAGSNSDKERVLLKGKGYSSELIEDIMKQTEYEQYKGESDFFRTYVAGGMTSPAEDRKQVFAQQAYARQEELHNTLTKLKKRYGGIR